MSTTKAAGKEKRRENAGREVELSVEDGIKGPYWCLVCEFQQVGGHKRVLEGF